MRVAVYAFVWFALSSLVWSQGYFLFSNRDIPRGVDAPVFDAQGNRLSGPGYLAALYVGPTLDSLQPVFRLSTSSLAIEPFSAVPGYIFGGPVEARNVAGGTLVWVQMRAWDAGLGATYEEARQLDLGGYGESSLLQLQSGAGIFPDPRPLIGLQSFSLRAVVPEPGAVSLFVVALPLLWLAGRHRRRPQEASGHDSIENM